MYAEDEGRAVMTDATKTIVANDEDGGSMLVYDYRARASLGQLPISEKQAIQDALLALAHDDWDLNAPSLLSVTTLRDQRGAYYAIRLKVASDVEVVLRPVSGDSTLMTVVDVLNYEALRNVAGAF